MKLELSNDLGRQLCEVIPISKLSKSLTKSDQGHMVKAKLKRVLNIVLTGISSDSHTWNLVFMQILLEHIGHNVINLGACTPDQEVVEACMVNGADMLVVSTVNGHGNIDGERLIRLIRSQYELRNMPAVIGGKLGLLGDENSNFSDGLLRAGFSAVFNADSSLINFEEFVKKISDRHLAIPTSGDLQ